MLVISSFCFGIICILRLNAQQPDLHFIECEGLEQFKEKGELKGDAAKRCLGTITDKITVVTTAIRKLVPGSRDEEKRAES